MLCRLVQSPIVLLKPPIYIVSRPNIDEWMINTFKNVHIPHNQTIPNAVCGPACNSFYPQGKNYTGLPNEAIAPVCARMAQFGGEGGIRTPGTE